MGQWVRLAFVGLLAGELSSGGGCNFQIPQSPHGGAAPSHFPLPFPSVHTALFVGIITLLVVLVFLFTILFLYISSVMRFVLFDSVLTKDCHIREGWSRRQRPAFRFFVWQIVLLIVFCAGLIILIGLPVGFAFAIGWLKHPGEHVLALVLSGLALFFVLAALVICLAVVTVLTKDFVVPQMALEDITAFEAWRRLLPMLREEKGGYAAYLGMKIVMAIGASILVGIVSLIVVLVILIPVGGLGLVAILGGKAAGLTWNLYTITMVAVAGLIAVAVIVYALAVISVPVIVFFPAYSIYFFAARYRPLAAVLYPPSPPSLPLEPEPLPIT